MSSIIIPAASCTATMHDSHRLNFSHSSTSIQPSILRLRSHVTNKIGHRHHRHLTQRVSSSHGFHHLPCSVTSAIKPDSENAGRPQGMVEKADGGEAGGFRRDQPAPATRRKLLQAATLGSLLVAREGLNADSAHAVIVPPQGYRTFVDKLDGYYFFYPQDWLQVKGAGADAFFRDPSKLDENLSVNISSPSSSRFKAVSDLGSPEEAGEFILRQYLTEFMSTRIGVQRESTLLRTEARTGGDGREYYDIQVNVKSYANNNQLAIRPEDRVVQLEWDRRYLLTLGVENNRLYQLRLQLPERFVEQDMATLRKTMESLQLLKLGGES